LLPFFHLTQAASGDQKASASETHPQPLLLQSKAGGKTRRNEGKEEGYPVLVSRPSG
jgi:hypothetical protein